MSAVKFKCRRQQPAAREITIDPYSTIPAYIYVYVLRNAVCEGAHAGSPCAVLALSCQLLSICIARNNKEAFLRGPVGPGSGITLAGSIRWIRLHHHSDLQIDCY